MDKMIKRLVNKYKTDETFKHILWITTVYMFAQGFLLIATGIWWDDWVYVNKNWDYLLEVMLQSSLPLQAYIDASLWLLPDGAYRILVFIYFYAGSLLVYTIMKKMDMFSSEDVFWITLLYITIPINDARIAWICYGYSLGLLSFWIAFWLVTLWQGKTGKRAVIMRVLSLFVLVFSFNTESIMLMTLIILLYLYYERLKTGWEWSEVRANIKKCFRAVLCYIDFLLAPIIFYFGKHMLFPSYGFYAGHNYVDWNALPDLFLHSPVYAWDTMANLFLNYKATLLKPTVLIVLAIIVLCYMLVAYMHRRRKGIKPGTDIQYGRTIIMLLVGMFCFFSGFFPYVIRCKGAFPTIGTEGRHTLLLGIGVAMLIYYLVAIIFRKEIKKMMLILLIILGACHFNFRYLGWQEDYYQQLRFQAEIAENQDILDNDTFLCIDYWSNNYIQFYVLNGNSYTVTGEETRFYASNINDLFYMLGASEDAWYLKACNMRDWDYSEENRHLDGILLFKNRRISNSQLIKLKLEEFFDKDAFDRWIKETKDITYIPVTREGSDAIFEAYRNGKLTRDNVFKYMWAY